MSEGEFSEVVGFLATVSVDLLIHILIAAACRFCHAAANIEPVFATL
jgi:hypothetical protein